MSFSGSDSRTLIPSFLKVFKWVFATVLLLIFFNVFDDAFWLVCGDDFISFSILFFAGTPSSEGNLRFPKAASGGQGLRASPSDPSDPSLSMVFFSFLILRVFLTGFLIEIGAGSLSSSLTSFVFSFNKDCSGITGTILISGVFTFFGEPGSPIF